MSQSQNLVRNKWEKSSAERWWVTSLVLPLKNLTSLMLMGLEKKQNWNGISGKRITLAITPMHKDPSLCLFHRKTYKILKQ